jgi:hypothetical protein
MRGGNKTRGRLEISGSKNELDEYFTELENEEADEGALEPDGIGMAQTGLSAREEIGRLSACVAHLKVLVPDSTASPLEISVSPKQSLVGVAVVGLTVMGVLAAAFAFGARWARSR